MSERPDATRPEPSARPGIPATPGGAKGPSVPAGLFYGVLHLASALALALVFAKGIWGPIAFVLPIFGMATVGFALHYGPCLGILATLAILAEEIWLGTSPRRSSPGTILYFGAMVPFYLSTGFRAVLARRGAFDLGSSPRPPFAAGRAISGQEAFAFLLGPFAILGVVLPILATLRSGTPRWLDALANPRGTVAVWGFVLALAGAGAVASISRRRRMDPREARIVLLDTVRSWTGPLETRMWKGLVRAREAKRRRPPP